jgi:protein-S-isoprenylcysteine O-methyltransferase Ste14
MRLSMCILPGRWWKGNCEAGRHRGRGQWEIPGLGWRRGAVVGRGSLKQPRSVAVVVGSMKVLPIFPAVPVYSPTALTVLTTIKEEKVLLQRFGHQYEEYMQAVPWRLIPKIF